jgi:DNA-binding MarR family transcriptional regulator
MDRARDPALVSDAMLVVFRAVLQRSHAVAARTGLTAAQATLLPTLALGGRATVSDVAENIGLTLPAVTSAVDVLERRTLVRRVRDVEDRRKVWLEITPGGRRIALRQLRRFHPLHRRMNEMVPRAQAPAMAELLYRIAREIGAQERWFDQRCPLCHPRGRAEVRA